MSVTKLDTKTEIVQTLDRLSEEDLQQVLDCVRSLDRSSPDSHRDRVRAIYRELAKERAEVYRRLADS